MQPSLIRRIALVIVVVFALCTMLVMVLPSMAQDGGDTSRRLAPDQPVTGTLDADNFAESYVFAASTGDTISLSATTEAEELSLALLLTDPEGGLVASDGDLSTPAEATLTDVALETTGTYVVTVLRGTGADGDASGEYTLTLTGELTTPTSTPAPTQQPAATIREGNNVYIALEDGGIDISLQWSAAVDLNLEVRDPVGGTLYFDSLTVPSGGTHSGNTNGLCEDATADVPTEGSAWPQGYVPVGSYEVIIYYEQQCEVGGPQTFTLKASVNGEESQSVSGVLNPGQNYLARLTLDINRSWSVFNGGVNAGLDLGLPTNSQEIAFNQSAFGTIDNQKPKDGYTFNGAVDQTVTVDMSATSGSLDTLLILLGPDGRLIADNDDRTDGTSTDSLLQVTLPEAGLYTIVATRYGQVIGGTEGNYTLFLGQGTTTVDGTVATPVTTVATVPGGNVEVTLQWFTRADLQLQVRDPSGATVFDDTPSIASGGILDQNFVGNRGCVPATDGTPMYYIYWPTNRQPPLGTYEVEVWFQNDCDDPTPVNFDLTIEVGGQLLAAAGSQSTVSATATAVGNRYLITFTINAQGAVNLGTGNFFSMNSVSTGLDYTAQLATAQQLECDQTVQGRIDLLPGFAIYSFEGIAGDRISIGMARIGNTTSLDTAVYILDPLLTQVANNDDIEVGENTNSLIDEYQLDRDGTYYIIATRYGLSYGATTGDFTLNLDCLP